VALSTKDLLGMICDAACAVVSGSFYLLARRGPWGCRPLRRSGMGHVSGRPPPHTPLAQKADFLEGALSKAGLLSAKR
jgi:hypothetical protein